MDQLKNAQGKEKVELELKLKGEHEQAMSTVKRDMEEQIRAHEAAMTAMKKDLEARKQALNGKEEAAKKMWSAQPGVPMQERRIDLATTEASDIIFCGNPGVGKSTLLSSISGQQFSSGLSFGGGFTTEMRCVSS